MNKTIRIFRRSLLAMLAAGSLAACQKGEPTDPVGGGSENEPGSLTVIASLSGSAATRATAMTVDDLWSATGFATGDVLGFYSSAGNYKIDDGDGPFFNQPLAFNGGLAGSFEFKSADMLVSPTKFKSGEIYIYYPYTEQMDNPGLELRVNKLDTLRCVDFLTPASINISLSGSNNRGMLTGTFEHTFSELIIMRGKGFDNPPPGKEQITVVMKEPYTHVKINCTTSPWSCGPELVYEPTQVSAANRRADGDYRRWEAWQGGNYGVTLEDPGVAAWYVLLPTLGRGMGVDNRTTVEYIELFDNDGARQRVSGLQLAGGNTKLLDAGDRYPMEITMNELVPTVNPFRVIPWNGDIELTDERQRGISNITDFNLWRQAYATYLNKGDNELVLKNYGDLTTDEQGNPLYWHFYILADFSFGPLLGDDIEQDALIPVLNDILDGVSTTLENHTFLNHTLTGLNKPLVGKLAGPYAALQNIDFVKLSIDETGQTNPVGALVNTLDGGLVENCSITQGTVIGSGPVGMVAGSAASGAVRNCYLSGFMLGSSSDAESQYIFGRQTGSGATLEENTSLVQFNNN